MSSELIRHRRARCSAESKSRPLPSRLKSTHRCSGGSSSSGGWHRQPHVEYKTLTGTFTNAHDPSAKENSTAQMAHHSPRRATDLTCLGVAQPESIGLQHVSNCTSEKSLGEQLNRRNFVVWSRAAELGAMSHLNPPTKAAHISKFTLTASTNCQPARGTAPGLDEHVRNLFASKFLRSNPCARKNESTRIQRWTLMCTHELLATEPARGVEGLPLSKILALSDYTLKRFMVPTRAQAYPVDFAHKDHTYKAHRFH